MYQKEEWVLVNLKGNQGKYSISSYGRVYNNFDNVYVSPVLTGKPQYWYVNLTPVVGKRTLKRVHNLMMKSFKPEGEFKGASVDHIDRNRYNNCLWNLRWASRKKQSQNRCVAITLPSGVLLKEWCSWYYKNTNQAYNYYYKGLRNNKPIQELIANFKVEPRGCAYIINDKCVVTTAQLCKMLNIDSTMFLKHTLSKLTDPLSYFQNILPLETDIVQINL